MSVRAVADAAAGAALLGVEAGDEGSIELNGDGCHDAMLHLRWLTRSSGAGLALVMPLLLAGPGEAGSAVGESIWGQAAARAQALRQVPAGATRIRTRCREINIRGDFRYRCTVRYMDPSEAPEGALPSP